MTEYLPKGKTEKEEKKEEEGGRGKLSMPPPRIVQEGEKRNNLYKVLQL